MLVNEQFKFAIDVSKLINFIFDQGYFVTLGEAYRTQEQADIYAKQGKGIHDSLHCKRLAVDLNIYDGDGKWITEGNIYKILADYWEQLDKHNRAGYYFITKYGGKICDQDHFERHI